MIVEESERNWFHMARVGLKVEATNGFVREMGNRDMGSTENGIQIYKRRKYMKLSSSDDARLLDDRPNPTDLDLKLTVQSTKEQLKKAFDNVSCNHVNNSRLDLCMLTNGSNDLSPRCCTQLVLQQMNQSLADREGGLRDCIQNSLLSRAKSGCTTTNKEESLCFAKGSQSNLTWKVVTSYEPEDTPSVIWNGPLKESESCINTELCKRAFSDILSSAKFTEVCELLLKNFGVVKTDQILDFSLMNARMKEGAYENSPMLFSLDLRQVWTKLQRFGSQLVDLTKDLSTESWTRCRQAGILTSCNIDKDIRNEQQIVELETDEQAKSEQREANDVHRICSCGRCGEKADGRNCLVCDSCEEMYHVSCIEPAVGEEVSLINWYCSKCISKGIASPHDNCTLCERLNAAPLVDEVEGISDISHEERNLDVCFMCKCGIKKGEKFRTCGHSFCAHKFYHDNCLSSKQLGTYGCCWYCPSCLCRTCLTDKDDEKIVLCDGCDQAYHTYCMEHPRDSIPKGKWFCKKCDSEIQSIRKAKRVFECMQKNVKFGDARGRGHYGNVKHVGLREDGFRKSGGVDMLLTAASTLNYQESMAALEIKR